MLRSFAGTLIRQDYVPYPAEWHFLQERLTLAQFDQIKQHITTLIDQESGEFITSRWLRHNWQGTPLQIINDIGGGSRLFVLLFWITFRDHEELFDFRGEAGGINPARLIYSRHETLN